MLPSCTPFAAINITNANPAAMMQAWPRFSMLSVTWLLTAARS